MCVFINYINYMQSMEKQQRFVEVEFSFTVIFQFKHCRLYIFSLRLCQNLQIMESNSLLETNNGSTKTIQ